MRSLYESHKRPAIQSPFRQSCNSYTRVSTEYGLDQEFNSLDAQHETAFRKAVTVRRGFEPVRLSALAGSAVHRMTAASGSSRSEISNRCKRNARRARLASRPSAVHQVTKPYNRRRSGTHRSRFGPGWTGRLPRRSGPGPGPGAGPLTCRGWLLLSRVAGEALKVSAIAWVETPPEKRISSYVARGIRANPPIHRPTPLARHFGVGITNGCTASGSFVARSACSDAALFGHAGRCVPFASSHLLSLATDG
jgi:hypothetical protein